MHQFKILARILLILPIINFAFALPIAVQETRQVFGDVVPAGKPDSDIAGLKGLQPEAPGSMDPPQMGTSEIQQVSPELYKSPSLGHYLPESETSDASADDDPLLPATSYESGSSSSMVKPKSKSFLKKVVSKLSKLRFKFKFWRRIFSPGSVRDAVNAA
jgi:hypothetical protein